MSGKGLKTIQGREKSLFNMVPGKWISICKQLKLDFISHLKINSKCIRDV